ncbi:MAG: hypothetical protein AAF706_00260, partial [Bacteroidota bacterium]
PETAEHLHDTPLSVIVGDFLDSDAFWDSRLDAWTTLQTWKRYSLVLAQLGIHYHYQALSKGVIDLRDVAYFLSLIILTLLTSRWILLRKR